MRKKNHILLLLSALFLASCSMTKGLKESERLHDATNFVFENPQQVNHKKRVESELLLLARPVPATGPQKWQVGLHQSVNKKNREKGLGRWIQKKIGKPPVIYDATKAERSRAVMEKHLHDIGYFRAVMTMDTLTKGKKVAVNYHITSRGQYFLSDIHYPADTLPLTHLLHADPKARLLEPGKPYQLAQLEAERARLAGLANDQGFYEITKNNFFYFVDTTAGNFHTDVYLQMKQTGDSSIYQTYYLDDTWVYPDFSLERRDGNTAGLDTISRQNLHIVQKKKVLRPTVLGRMVYQDSVQLFSQREQQQTINRLLSLGIYKFANLRFEKQVRQDSHFLVRSVFLTPGLMRDLSTEFQVNSRSGNFLGTEVSGTFSHRNAFRGAELFNLSLSTGIETNVGANAGSIINTLNAGLSASLQLPSIYAPFVDRNRVRGQVLPRTAFAMSDDFQRRTGFYAINSFNLSFGYNWRGNRLAHEFNPAFVNFIHLLSSSDELEDLLATNRRLRNSFEDVLILGMNYYFSISNQSKNISSRYFFYRGGVETAGNLTNLFSGNAPTGHPSELLGVPFSQYLRTDHDIRQYFPLRKGRLAGRINFGIAYPYGNAEVVPYTKQYFVGGASSIRAFRIRTLGPGSYQSKLDEGSNFVDQTGDLKLEANLEYRFPVFSYLKGALFVDAGNVWLIQGDADEATPESEGLFKFDQFYREIAVGTGFGVRIDFDVAAIRLDWAFPLRGPSENGKMDWRLSHIDFLSKNWRKENLVLNIAIGYPF